MSTLSVTNLKNAASATNNLVLNPDGSVNISGGTLSPQTGFKNRLINGNMVLNQRGVGAQVPLAPGVYLVDRWIYNANQSTRYNAVAATASAPNGFTTYLSYTSTGAFSPAAGDWQAVEQRIEGFNFSDMGWGTASAQTVTVSFVVRSSLTGTFSGSINNADTTRSYPFNFTISAANTWETKSVTIAGDTTGTWLTNNGIGASVRFNLGTGSTYLATAGAWTGTQTFGATGSVNVSGTSGATFWLTGVQLERGSVATPFEFRSIGDEFLLCQRYYQKCNSVQAATVFNNELAVVCALGVKVEMRADPTILLVSASFHRPGIAFYAASAVSGAPNRTGDGYTSFTIASGAGNSTAGQMIGQFFLSAEL